MQQDIHMNMNNRMERGWPEGPSRAYENYNNSPEVQQVMKPTTIHERYNVYHQSYCLSLELEQFNSTPNLSLELQLIVRTTTY